MWLSHGCLPVVVVAAGLLMGSLVQISATKSNCSCIYQGGHLPASLYNNYPLSLPGKYNTSPLIKVYGTMCAAWDSIPDAPFHETSCTPDCDYTVNFNSWCMTPWCYVNKTTCEHHIKSFAFMPADMYFSYRSCAAPSCFDHSRPQAKYVGTDPGCPFKLVHKTTCPCKYHSKRLPDTVLGNYSKIIDITNPGNLRWYGTTCAAWDMIQGAPWYEHCMREDLCSYEANWCQAPWCFVDEDCSSKIETSVFKGSEARYISYDTCASTPDCISKSGVKDRENLPSSCPFDIDDNNWSTPRTCPKWSNPDDTDDTQISLAIRGVSPGSVTLAAVAMAALLVHMLQK